MPHFFGQHARIEGCPVEQTGWLQDSLGLQIHASKEDTRLDFAMVEGHGINLNTFHLDHGAALQMLPEAKRYWLAIMAEVTSQSNVTRVVRQPHAQGWISSPDLPLDRQRFRVNQRNVYLGLGITQDAIHAFAAQFLDLPLRGCIRLARDVDYAKGAGRVIWQTIKAVAEEDVADPTRLSDSRYLKAFRDQLISHLLLLHPHSHTALFRAKSPGPAPRDVRRARDYIEAHLDRALSLEELTEVANVPGRTLNEHFRSFLGLSPVAYHRERRLAAARQGLQDGTYETVAEAAQAHGFQNHGRFARAFRTAFGEPPSALLRRRA